MVKPSSIFHRIHWRNHLMWCVIAAIAAICCVVLPPHLITGGIKESFTGQSLFPWFQAGMYNLAFTPTRIALGCLGLFLGMVQPRIWWIVGVVPFFTLVLLLGIDMIWFQNGNHNLWPFEVMAYFFLCWPALAGAFLGFAAIRLLRRRKT